MEIKGSCHCGSVKFTVQSPHPYPFNLCYCSICRKTAGGGAGMPLISAGSSGADASSAQCPRRMLLRQWAQIAAMSDVSMSATAAVSEGAATARGDSSFGGGGEATQ